MANVLRLLKLPAEVQAEVASGGLSMGHARALLALPTEPEQLRVSRDVVARKLSVRETETLVKRAVESPPSAVSSRESAKTDPNTREAEERLRLQLGTRVRIVRKGPRGRIEIDFGSEQELIRIFDQLTGG